MSFHSVWVMVHTKSTLYSSGHKEENTVCMCFSAVICFIEQIIQNRVVDPEGKTFISTFHIALHGGQTKLKLTRFLSLEEKL